MGQGAGSRDRYSSVWVPAATSAICILVLVVTGGILAGPASGSKAKKPKRPEAPRAAGYPPAAATGAFGIDLLRTLQPGNVVLSPDSVAAALAMTGTGGAGRTTTEIARTLRLKGPANLAGVGDLQRAILAGHSAAGAGDPDPPILEIANGLFLQRGLPFDPAFISGAQQRFAAVPQTVDFRGDPGGALETVNGWVSEKTRGKIPRILSTPPRNLALALANAIYLDADWEHPFDEGDTRPGPFHGTAAKGTVPLMNQTTNLRYGAGRGYKAVALPYESSTLSMLVVLPVKQRLGALQRQLGGKGVGMLARRLRLTRVELSLPRFHLRTETELTGVLAKLGMPTPFSGAADFSRITTAERLQIAFVKHAADITVDEGGTVAAAATVVGVGPVSAPPRAIPFRADRPFLFFLRDDRTGAVLFAGRLTQAGG